jgi:hypothetical protein
VTKLYREYIPSSCNNISAVLCMGTMGSCSGVPRAKEPHTNLYTLYTAWFLMFKHWFCWKYQYKKYISI